MLPTKRTPVKKGHDGRSFLLYGPPKIGKSTFCSQIPDALFLATEDGLGDLEVYQVRIYSWEDLERITQEIAKGDHQFKAVVIDTVDNAYRMCSEAMCSTEGVRHESDLEWGKGWALTNTMFRRALLKLSVLDYGLWLVAHSMEKKFRDRTGEYAKAVPNLPKGGSDAVFELCDYLFYCDFEESTREGHPQIRVLRTQPSKYWDAGARTHGLPDPLSLQFTVLRQALVKALPGDPVTPTEQKTNPTPEAPQEPTSQATEAPGGPKTRLWKPERKKTHPRPNPLLQGQRGPNEEDIERAKRKAAKLSKKGSA